MVHDMHTRRRRPDYLQACPTGLPVDGVKSALTLALWPCTFCSDLLQPYCQQCACTASNAHVQLAAIEYLNISGLVIDFVTSPVRTGNSFFANF